MLPSLSWHAWPRWCQTSAVECSEPTWIRSEGAAASPVGSCELPWRKSTTNWPTGGRCWGLAASWQAVFWKFGLLGSLLQPKDVHQIREDTPAPKTHSAHMCTSYTSCNCPSALSSSTELGVELLAEEVKELTLVDIDKGR